MRGRLALSVLLLSFALETSGADPQSQAPKNAETATSVLWVSFEILNLKPALPFRITFDHGRFVGEIQLSKDTSKGLGDGLQLDAGVLTYTPPPGTQSSSDSKIAFIAPMSFAGPGSGRVEAQAPLVAVLNAGYGASVLQSGGFHLATKTLPPTCMPGCIQEGFRCGNEPAGKCYLYDSQFMCCTVCPTGC